MGRKAKGSTLQIGDGVTPTEGFTAVAELTKFDPPQFGTGTIESTSFDSAAKEYESDGIQDHGSIDVEGNWVPELATQSDTTGLLAKAIAGNKTSFKVIVPTATGTLTFQFKAFVMFKPAIGGPSDLLKFTGTLQITGPVTRTTV